MSPFFSIVIPCYNRKHLISYGIDSLLNQSYPDFEIIVVDDGSNDGTAEYIRSRYPDEKRIKVISQQNKERGAARNNGLQHATGKYVYFMDSDDTVSSDHLAVLHDKIVLLDEPNFIATKFVFRGASGDSPSPLCALTEGYYDYRSMLEGNHFGTFFCVKRENPSLFLFEEDRKYSILEDWMFLVKNLRHDRIYLIDRITYFLVDHEGRSMHTDHRILNEKKKLAGSWILQNVGLDSGEQKTLLSNIEYFCAIHAYIDGARSTSLKHILSAIRIKGPEKRFVILFFKVIAGKRSIELLRKLIKQ